MAVSLRRFQKERRTSYLACIRELVLEHNPYIHLSLTDVKDSHIMAWIKEHSLQMFRHNQENAVCYYWICDGDEVVGIASLKPYLQNDLYTDSGHIGLCIRSSQRRKGYARIALILLIKEAYEHYHIHDILLCCSYENVISRRLCECVHGVLKHEDSYCHYWISEHPDKITDID